VPSTTSKLDLPLLGSYCWPISSYRSKEEARKKLSKAPQSSAKVNKAVVDSILLTCLKSGGQNAATQADLEQIRPDQISSQCKAIGVFQFFKNTKVIIRFT
jgi:hypothetical protein